MKTINVKSFISPRTTVCFGLLLITAAVLLWRGGEISARQENNPAFAVEQSAGSTAFSAFDNWMKQYLSGEFGDEKNLPKRAKSWRWNGAKFSGV
jgi:hypothetical protein